MSLDSDEIKVEVLRLLNEGMPLSQISQRVGVSSSTISRFANKKTYVAWWEQNHKPIAAGDVKDHREGIPQLEGNRFIITSAQNNTYVHRQFLESLETMADRIGARIIVGTFSYNLNGFQNLQKSEGEWFDPLIQKYTLDEPAVLADGLAWCGELNILPTAVNPLSGLHSYTKGASGIVPHAKMQLESLPTHKSEAARMMYTTGAVTKRNYIQKKAGQKASFHHVFGALLVEVDEAGDWFVRQLVAESDTGRFQDLDTIYTPYGYYENQHVEAINWGDLHSEKKNIEVYKTSFVNEDSMLNALKPKYQFVHDVLDFRARNHHNIKDPYFVFRNYMNQTDSVKDNVMDVIQTLRWMNRDWCQTVVVESNHDLALKRWLKESDYKTDPVNAIFYLECQLAMYTAIGNGVNNFSIFEHAVKKESPELSEVVFLKTDQSFEICGPDGIECGQHGHLGINGSRGNIQAYQKLGTRYNIGHSHSATIKDGVYQAGVSGDLDMEYNMGGSSWSHSHIVTYPNGKRTIVTLKNGKYRA